MSETALIQELNYDEAADVIGIKRSRLRRLVKNGQGPKHRRDGRSVTFLREHLQEWVDEYRKSAYTKTASHSSKRGRRAAKQETTGIL